MEMEKELKQEAKQEEVNKKETEQKQDEPAKKEEVKKQEEASKKEATDTEKLIAKLQAELEEQNKKLNVYKEIEEKNNEEKRIANIKDEYIKLNGKEDNFDDFYKLNKEVLDNTAKTEIPNVITKQTAKYSFFFGSNKSNTAPIQQKSKQQIEMEREVAKRLSR
jgi:chromosome segregation ATPase